VWHHLPEASKSCSTALKTRACMVVKCLNPAAMDDTLANPTTLADKLRWHSSN
jgi:hypothetical protein